MHPPPPPPPILQLLSLSLPRLCTYIINMSNANTRTAVNSKELQTTGGQSAFYSVDNSTGRNPG